MGIQHCESGVQAIGGGGGVRWTGLSLYVTLFVRGGRGVGGGWGRSLGEHPVCGGDGWAAEAGGAGTAGAVWARPWALTLVQALAVDRGGADGSDWLGPEGGAGTPCRQGRFEGGHCLGGGAGGAASQGCVRVPDHHGVEGASRTLRGPWRVLQGLQGVQDDVRGVLRYVLTLQLA